MDGGTPKKIVDSDSNCFTCSSPSENGEKIYIFGKSSIDLHGIIKSSLNVDVICFANSGKIFVCRSVCYKRLSKFQRSSEKLNEIRQKIEEVFKKRDEPRTKRLQRASEKLHGNIPEGNHQDKIRDMSRTQESLNRQKVSKSLQFGTSEATTCTSSANSSYQDFSSWKLPVPAYLPSFLSPIQSQPSLLLSAFPNVTCTLVYMVKHERESLINKRFSEPCRQVYKDILLIDHNCLNCPLLMRIYFQNLK